MAKVYLDANVYIDLLEDRHDFDKVQLNSHVVCASVLSVHIYTYIYKVKMPVINTHSVLQNINFIPLDEEITIKSLAGPTTDFEDNVQLHSAATAECDYFFTRDERLLVMGYFGKTQIVSEISR